VEIKFGEMWVEVAFGSLKKGDLFRMYESDGTPVRDRGTDQFIATSDAYYETNIDGHAVKYEPFYG